jgi:hypothetical protein
MAISWSKEIASGAIAIPEIWAENRDVTKGTTDKVVNTTNIVRTLALVGGLVAQSGLISRKPSVEKYGEAVALGATPLFLMSVYKAAKSKMNTTSWSPSSFVPRMQPASQVRYAPNLVPPGNVNTIQPTQAQGARGSL